MLSVRCGCVVALGTIVLAAALQGPSGARAGDGDGRAAIGPPELPALERRIREVAARAIPSFVALPGGTGVIVSPDGLVLSQGHVTHGAGHSPGDRVSVHLGDGAEVEAELLGEDRLYDLSALRLLKPGPYPAAPLAEAAPGPGEDVLKLGYPMPLGHRRGRPPELRFGRVMDSSADCFLTDCRINGGDSGGPFFDLRGRVVGIVGPSGRVADGDLAGGSMFIDRGGLWFNATPAPQIRGRLRALADGRVIEAAEADRDRLRAAFTHRRADVLAAGRGTQGTEFLRAFRGAVGTAREAVVEVLDGDAVAALATVVDASGLVLTAASEVPDGARCRLPGGRVVVARVVGVDPAYNPALLRVEAAGLSPVAWAGAPGSPAGTLVAAAGPGELPLAVGVVSRTRQDSRGPHPAAVPRRPPGGRRRSGFGSSGRWDPPPTFLVVDAPVIGPESGCPVVGLDGKAIGLVTARFGPNGCYVVPADTLIARVADLRLGRPSADFPSGSAPPR